MAMPYRQRGVALITAILMVAIATALATKLAWDNQVNMRRTEATINMEQARQLGLTTEAVAISMLLEFGKDSGNNALDLEETGVIQTEAMVEDQSLGLITAQLFDMQGRMNINNLVINGTVQKAVKDQFRLLFESLDVDVSLLDAIIDWIDGDSVAYGMGAEDGDYSSLEPPYRPANNYLMDISELRAIRGIDAETYEILAPHVTAIPPGWCGISGISKVNLNFASPEVIAAVTGVGPGVAADMAKQRDETPWDDVGQIQLPPNTGADPLEYISATTDCFHLSVTVEVGSSTLTMYSLLDRAANSNNPGNQIVARARAYGLEN